MSYYSKPFLADVGSIQIFCRIRLTENLSKALYTEPLSYKCNIKLNRRWICFVILWWYACISNKPMLKLKIIAEGYTIWYNFFRRVVKKVGLFCPWVPVAKYSLLLLFKKSLLFFIFFTMYLDILHNFFFFKMNKWMDTDRNKAKTNVLCSLFHASTSWLESVYFIILAKEIINANIV